MYSEVQDADVLLYRGDRFPSLGWYIAKQTASPYSHVSLAKWEEGRLFALEFKEFVGSRKISVENYLERGYNIDVFRAARQIIVPNGPYSYRIFSFTDETVRSIIQDAERLLGLEYGWPNIWKIIRSYTPLAWGNPDVTYFDDTSQAKDFVCSTLITYTYRKHFIDPTPNLSDEFTKPSDIARSAIFRKIGSISREEENES